MTVYFESNCKRNKSYCGVIHLEDFRRVVILDKDSSGEFDKNLYSEVLTIGLSPSDEFDLFFVSLIEALKDYGVDRVFDMSLIEKGIKKGVLRMDRVDLSLEEYVELKSNVNLREEEFDSARFEDIMVQISDLVNEAYELIPSGTGAKSRAGSYWLPHILGAISNDSGYLGGSAHNMQDTLDEIDDLE